MNTPDTPVRLNILTLPSQTTILFLLIFLVIGIPVLLSAVGPSVPCGPVVIVCILSLTIWDFLSIPDRQIRKLHLTGAETDFPTLAESFKALATDIAKLPHPPRLMISSVSDGIFSFGTFTRRYVAISRQLGGELEGDLASPDPDRRDRANAILLHELAHFRNGDVWKAFLSRSLLKMTAGFLLISLLNTLTTPFLYYYGAKFYLSNFFLTPEMLEPFDPNVATMLETLPPVGPQAILRYEMYAFTAQWPMIVGALLLLIFFWRRLLRLRELYADARVIAWQGKIEPLLRAMPWVASVVALQPGISPIRRLVPRIAFSTTRYAGRFKRLISFQPGLVARQQYLREPHRIYGSPFNMAAVAGFTVVLLNLTLSSLFTSRFIRGPNATIPLVIGFAVLAISFTPVILYWTENWSRILRPLGLATLGFTLIRIAPQILVGIIVAIGVLLFPETIDQSAYALVLAGGEDLPSLGIEPPFVIDIYVIRPLLFSALVLPTLLLLLLVLDTWLKREILTWYGGKAVRDHLAAVLWGASGVLVSIIALSVLPVANALVFPTAYSLLSLGTLVEFALALPLLIGLPVVLWLGHRRYAHRCPACNAKIPGYYRLGLCCESCGELLHPHLVNVSTTSS